MGWYILKMINVDYIMGLIDWNKSINEQLEGVKLAKEVQSINVFLQPCNKSYNKNVWDNCAKILSERTDEELSPYLVEMLNWLRDINWPGSLCIFNRLQKYADDSSYNLAFDSCLKCAQVLEDNVWENNLKMLNEQRIQESGDGSV